MGDKAREATLAAKVEHIKKMRAEHKNKAGHGYTELDKSKKEEEQRTEKERQDIWGTKLGAAGVAVRKTVDMGLDDAAAEAKAEEEEKIHSVKQGERDGKTKREAALVKDAGVERTSKTGREQSIEAEEKKLRADEQEMKRKEAAEKKKEASAKAERAKKEADEKKLEKAAKAREPPCGDGALYCQSIKEWSEILDALEKKSKALAKDAAKAEKAEKAAVEERTAKGAAEKDKLAEDRAARIAKEGQAKADREQARAAKAKEEKESKAAALPDQIKKVSDERLSKIESALGAEKDAKSESGWKSQAALKKISRYQRAVDQAKAEGKCSKKTDTEVAPEGF